MLLSEIIWNIKNLYNGGIQSDDVNLSDEQLAHIINYYRAKLIKQEQEKSKAVKDLFIQNLGKLDVSKFDKNECCIIENCVLRTKLKIPKPLESSIGLNLSFVGLLNGKPFQRYNANSAYWKQNNKYTNKSPGYYYQNGYIYLINTPNIMLSYINIQGIFEDPKVAEDFRTCDCSQNNEKCSDTGFDFEYPIPAHLEDTLFKMIMDAELRVPINQTDTTNNSLSETSNITNK